MKTFFVREEARSSERAPDTQKPGSGEYAAPSGRRGNVFDLLLVMFLVCVLMFGVVRPFVAEVFRIPSDSMSPTLQVGDSVLAFKLAYRLESPAQGDLVLFEGSDGEVAIKRVVGLPGDEIYVYDGVLRVNGEPRRESYVDYNLTDSTFFGPERVPAGHVFVMGDNRSNSLDSRSLGPVSEEDLLGRVLLRVSPLDRVDTF